MPGLSLAVQSGTQWHSDSDQGQSDPGPKRRARCLAHDARNQGAYQYSACTDSDSLPADRKSVV